MCGIAGIVDFEQGADNRLLTETMLDRIAYRGPDGRGLQADGPCTLGHVRLAIIDLSEKGRQPMCGRSERVWVACNGEIYNFPDLREDLQAKGHDFRSGSDTEALVRLYEERGADFVEDLRGMFAFGLWDGERKRLVLARDPMGKKPLYFVQDGKKLAFASEITALLEVPWVSRRLNRQALHDFWSYRFNPREETFFAGIRRLNPGEMALFDEQGFKRHTYWQLPAPADPDMGFAEACEEFESRLEDAVRKRLLSDVPVCAFLSGGLDSSSIVALMARHQQQVKTYTVAFPGKDYDESPYAREFAKQYGTDHTEIPFQDIAFSREILDMVVDHFGEPFGDSSALPSYFITKAMKETVTVALSGDGADEVLAGYNNYRWLEKLGDFSRMPKVMASAGAGLAGLAGVVPGLSGSNKLRQARKGLSLVARGDQLSTILGTMTFLTPKEQQELFADTGGYHPLQPPPAAYGQDHLGKSLIEDSLRIDLKQKLPDDMLVKVDRMSMANAFEVRSPFLDQDLVRWVVSLPLQYKYHQGETKRLLRHSMGKHLNEQLLKKPKTGFAVSLSAWRNQDMIDQARDLFAESRISAQGLFKPAAVSAVLDDFLNIDQVPAARLSRFQVEHRFWLMLVFQRWHQKYMEAA